MFNKRVHLLVKRILISLEEFVVLTYRIYLMFKALKMKFILAYVHLQCHSNGTVQVV